MARMEQTASEYVKSRSCCSTGDTISYSEMTLFTSGIFITFMKQVVHSFL